MYSVFKVVLAACFKTKEAATRSSKNQRGIQFLWNINKTNLYKTKSSVERTKLLVPERGKS